MVSAGVDSLKSKKVLRSTIIKQHSEEEAVGAPDRSPWSSKTPEKATQPPRHPRNLDLKIFVCSSDPLQSSATLSETLIKKPKTLPERYEILDRFFSSLQSCILLLGASGCTSTFTKISSMVEKSTGRRFSYGHLAQLTFILPEGIEIKKILVHDEQTSCMKPDLELTLNFCIIRNVKKLKSKSKNLRMRNLFRSRLFSYYYKSSRKGDEVPEGILPELFNQWRRVASSYAPNLAMVHMFHPSRRRIPNKNAEAHLLPDLGKNGDIIIPSMDGTPAKPISTPAQPVRGFMTPDEDSKMLTKPSSCCRISMAYDALMKHYTFSDDDPSASIKESKEKPMGKKYRKRMIAKLPRLFESLLKIFRVRPVMSKKELMHLIFSRHLEVVDLSEMDDQLRLMLELAPEWIQEKMTCIGEPFICVDWTFCPDSIRTRLSEAK